MQMTVNNVLPAQHQSAFKALKHVPFRHADIITKYNKTLRPQQRLILVTNTHIYSCLPAEGDIQRCISFDSIKQVRIFRQNNECALMIPSEYDFLLRSSSNSAFEQFLFLIPENVVFAEVSAPLTAAPESKELSLEKPRAFTRQAVAAAEIWFPPSDTIATADATAATAAATAGFSTSSFDDQQHDVIAASSPPFGSSNDTPNVASPDARSAAVNIPLRTDGQQQQRQQQNASEQWKSMEQSVEAISRENQPAVDERGAHNPASKRLASTPPSISKQTFGRGASAQRQQQQQQQTPRGFNFRDQEDSSSPSAQHPRSMTPHRQSVGVTQSANSPLPPGFGRFSGPPSRSTDAPQQQQQHMGDHNPVMPIAEHERFKDMILDVLSAERENSSILRSAVDELRKEVNRLTIENLRLRQTQEELL